MYNLRYHMASLAAVFLALAVGLVLGTVVAERGMITDQGTALVKELQQRFDEISDTNEELRAGLERDRAFAEDLEPLVVSGSLPGHDVAVIVGTGRVDGLNAVNAAVEEAGGVPFVASLETPGLDLADSAPEGLVGYFMARGIEMADPGGALEDQVAEALVAEWRSAGPRPLTELLVSSGLVSLESMSDTATVDALVIMAAADGGADPFALALGRAMRDGGLIAIGAEAESTESGVAAACADEGVFGSGDGAEGYYPPIAVDD